MTKKGEPHEICGMVDRSATPSERWEEAQAAHEMRYLREMVRRNQEREAVQAQVPPDRSGDSILGTEIPGKEFPTYLADIWDGLIFVGFVIAVLGILSC